MEAGGGGAVCQSGCGTMGATWYGLYCGAKGCGVGAVAGCGSGAAVGDANAGGAAGGA